MKNTFMVITLVFLCCFIVGCQQGERVLVEPKTDEADIQAIKGIVADYQAAINTSNVDGVMKAYADDALEIRPNEPALIGKEAIRGRKQKLFEDAALQEEYVVKNTELSGDLAVAHVAWSASFTIKAGGESGNTQGNWIWVFRRQSDASWKLIYSIWSDEQLIYPDQAEEKVSME